jgi:arylsulfatase A-like enzyme
VSARALVAASAVACAALALAAPVRRRPPHLLLLTVDTLRADALGVYAGGDRGTPAMDRLAREGTLFESAASPMPMTRPAHFSMLTSLYPRQHGVVNNRIVLPAEALTVAEVLKGRGYRTAAFTAVSLLQAASGAGQGFDHFEAPAGLAEGADAVVPRALRWIEAQGQAAPFFVWLHLFDPHMPYAPPTAEGKAFDFSWDSLGRLAEARGGDLPGEMLPLGLSLYAGEVSFVDSWVGRLLGSLEASGLGARTAVVLTADHGECFDHGVFFEHSQCLYDGSVRVPLVVRLPGVVAAGKREVRQVELVDVAPTLLELAGLPVPRGFAGRSLLGLASRGERAAFVEHPLFHEGARDTRARRTDRVKSLGGRPLRPLDLDADQHAARTREWKYVFSARGPELYALPRDPGEEVDLAGERPDVAGAFASALSAWRRRHPLRLAPRADVDPGVREALRALGYVQ